MTKSFPLTPVTIVLRRACGKGCPEGYSSDYAAGQRILIRGGVHYPGKDCYGGKNWSFADSTDIDMSHYFGEEDVAQVEVEDTPQAHRYFDRPSRPFEVVYLPAARQPTAEEQLSALLATEGCPLRVAVESLRKDGKHLWVTGSDPLYDRHPFKQGLLLSSEEEGEILRLWGLVAAEREQRAGEAHG